MADDQVQPHAIHDVLGSAFSIRLAPDERLILVLPDESADEFMGAMVNACKEIGIQDRTLVIAATDLKAYVLGPPIDPSDRG